MGHVGFYNSLLVAMGNVVSALLMCALQAAWLCQRLIDQDYRQNHGSRLTPILPSKEVENSIQVAEATPVIVLPEENYHHEMGYSTPKTSRTKKFETKTLNSSRNQRSSSENRRRKYGHRRKHYSTNEEDRLTISHPYLENVSDALTFEYVSKVGQVLGLRRAFSDINISSSVDGSFCEVNGNCPVDGMSDMRTAMTDQDYLRLIFTKGYVT